jgi:urease accessory protein
MNPDVHWLSAFLQTSDALFPTGAYAHSLGFEEFVRLTHLRDEAGLRAFVENHLLPALETQELPYLRFAFDCACAAERCAVDREISAWKLARELRDASTQVGRRRLAALRAVNEHPAYAEYAECIRRDDAPGHHLVVCALQARVEGIPLPAALTAWFYQSVAGVCSAALKLIRIGQDGCQRTVRAGLVQAGGVIERSRSVSREEAGWFDPLLEISSMRHEFAEERLFIS